MSTRPASPPSVARWPFIFGDLVLLALALVALATAGSPPGLGAIAIAVACAAAGAALLVAPYLIDNEARVRVAEAAVRDATEAQARRLAQIAEQLAHAVSRSQSTEEQAGQALGTLEELAEKLAAQGEELAQALARSGAQETTALQGEIDRLTRERDEQLAALNERITTAIAAAAETQALAKKSAAATARAFDDIQARLRAFETKPVETANAEIAPPAPPPVAAEPKPHTAPAEPAAAPAEAPADANAASAIATPAAKPRAKRSGENGHETASPARSAPPVAPLELPLEGMPPPRSGKPSRSAAVTSLVATAYIGIGNKLFLRGEGPGLSWERGVPMQFLAIGKWGWTTADAAAPVTCRVYRNDDTPMLDENVVIAPGAKAELAPRF